MSPEELRASLEQLDVALVRAGAEQPTSLLPAPTLDEFADAEQRLGLSLPETIREWYRWRNGVPRAGNSWMQTMLIDYWEHLPLSHVDELSDMLSGIIRGSGMNDRPRHCCCGDLP